MKILSSTEAFALIFAGSVANFELFFTEKRAVSGVFVSSLCFLLLNGLSISGLGIYDR